MKAKLNKLALSLLGLCVVLCGGIFYYFSQTKQETPPKQINSKVVQRKDTKENVSNEEKKSKVEKSFVQTPKNSEIKTTNEQKNQEERNAFNQEVMSQNYYIEHVDDKGNLTYVKATEKELQALEAKTKNNQLSSYQVDYEGHLISVLATSERN